MEKFSIRLMTLSDVPKLERVMLECYSEDFFESEKSLGAKLEHSPSSCFVCCVNGYVCGYLLSVPALINSPPAFNSENSRVEEHPNCLYLHDLALMDICRGSGTGKKMVDAFFAAQKALGLESASLIAVQNSKRYWEKYGFSAVYKTPELVKKLSDYGEDAYFMTKP